MTDLIERDKAKMAVRLGVLSTATIYGRTDEGMTARKEIERAIDELPSAQPEITLESAIDYLHSIGWMQKHDKEITDSAYTEGYTAAESKYRKMWDEMRATKQDAVEDAWDMFQMISSAWYGKGCYSKQDDGSVYSRLSCRYMTFDDAVREFMEEIDDD